MKLTSTLLSVVMCIIGTIHGYSQTMNDIIDAPGDIAFVGYEHDLSSGYAFVFIDNCPPGTVIIIDDEEWGGLPTGWNSTSGEGANTWTNTTGAMIPKGTVIKVENGNNNPTATMGSIVESDSGFNLGSQDGIFAYIGTFRTTSVTFLAFVGDTDDPSPQTLADTDLILGLHTFNIDNISGDDEGIYTGSTICNGTAVECLQMINNSANWSGIGGGVVFPTSVPDEFNGTALPVRLIRFEGRLDRHVAQLEWETAQEVNNDYFSLQRSSDGLHFEEVGRIMSKGGSERLQSYTFKDYLSKSGIYYYRLSQVDLDGGVHDLETITIRFMPDKKEIKVGPNPFTDLVHLEVNNPNRVQSVLRIYDHSGRLIHHREVDEEETTIVNTSDWSTGSYYFQLLSNSNIVQRTLLKIH